MWYCVTDVQNSAAQPYFSWEYMIFFEKMMLTFVNIVCLKIHDMRDNLNEVPFDRTKAGAKINLQKKVWLHWVTTLLYEYSSPVQFENNDILQICGSEAGKHVTFRCYEL